jgi:alpha-glucosidase
MNGAGRSAICRIAFVVAVIGLCGVSQAANSWSLKSPEDRLEVQISYDKGFSYSILLRGKEVILPSRVDLKVLDKGWLGAQTGEPQVEKRTKEETVEFAVPRKYHQLNIKYNELELKLKDGSSLLFRAYDEGVAYRWKTAYDSEITVEDELAQFIFHGEANIWFPEEESTFTHQERVYKYLPLAEVTPERFCSTGVLIDLKDGRKVYISESDLLSYPGMFLRGAGEGKVGLLGKYAPFVLETTPTTWSDGRTSDRDFAPTKTAPCLAKTTGTRSFPWRVMLVTEKDTELLESEIIFNLAEPLKVEDPSWIKPGKVVWDWWNSNNLTGVHFRAGVNTETYKYYIDFAADYGIEYLLIDEGWCADSTNLLSEKADVDIKEICDYGKQKNVRVLLWVLWNALDDKLEEALTKFEKLGVAGVKVDFMQRDDQWMVDYYERISEAAAKHHLLVDFHGAYKPTGLRRSYPNLMTREGVTGLEQYKWGDVNSNPEQELMLPFIRMVAGPFDYTPGALSNANKASWRWNVDHTMSQGTRCHQMAMFVIYESPLQMLADSPSRYRQEPVCMKFLGPVPTVWDDTVALAGKVGDYVAMARRSGDDWYLGVMTDWDPRELEIKFDFLPEGSYQLEIWADGVNADRNGQDVSYKTREVTSGESLKIKMAPGGGWVARLRPGKAQDTISRNSP